MSTDLIALHQLLVSHASEIISLPKNYSGFLLLRTGAKSAATANIRLSSTRQALSCLKEELPIGPMICAVTPEWWCKYRKKWQTQEAEDFQSAENKRQNLGLSHCDHILLQPLGLLAASKTRQDREWKNNQSLGQRDNSAPASGSLWVQHKHPSLGSQGTADCSYTHCHSSLSSTIRFWQELF